MTTRSRAPVRATVVGIGGLLCMAAAYWYTYEPAPSIRVRWHEHVTAEARAAMERRFLLSNGRAPMADGQSIAYDLLDTRPGNVEAIVSNPNVRDTNDLDRDTYHVLLSAMPGERWMWVAHRLPGLRDWRVRWGLIGALAAAAVYGLTALSRR